MELINLCSIILSSVFIPIGIVLIIWGIIRNRVIDNEENRYINLIGSIGGGITVIFAGIGMIVNILGIAGGLPFYALWMGGIVVFGFGTVMGIGHFIINK